MSYVTYNGWNVIPMPSSPVPKEVMLHMNDSVGQTQSPFTMQSQIQAWPGADWWEIDVTMPPMKDAQARPWFAWLAALRGKANVFQLGDPLISAPYGAATGVPLIATLSLPGQTILTLNSLAASTANIFLPGDYLQLYYSLHMVAGPGPYNTDSAGQAAVEIFPSLRQAQNPGAGVGIYAAKGIWRLTDNKRSFSIIAQEPVWTISFKAIEAR